MNLLRRLATAALVAVLLAVVAVSNASGEPIALSTPAQLNPGDTFRFIFVTTGSTTAESTDIASYNAFVQAQASGATYNGATVNWKAIGSTATVAARDNVGGFNTAVPVFLPNGSQLAGDLSTAPYGLWFGSLLGPTNQRIDGSFFNGDVWSGSLSSGLGGGAGALGASEFPIFGLSSSSVAWLNSSTAILYSQRPMYGMSETLTVPPVPEPATYAMALAGIACGGFSMWRRRKRA